MSLRLRPALAPRSRDGTDGEVSYRPLLQLDPKHYESFDSYGECCSSQTRVCLSILHLQSPYGRRSCGLLWALSAEALNIELG